MMLSGTDPRLDILRSQSAAGSVAIREMTGHGFFTEFSIPEDCPIVTETPSFEVNNVYGDTEQLKNGIGFVLFVRHGRLAMLEGYTYDEPWPDDLKEVRLSGQPPVG